MPFDPAQPFEMVAEEPGFDPSQPFEVVGDSRPEASGFDPAKPYKVVQSETETGDTLRAPSRWEKIKQGFQDIAPSLLSTERSQIDDKPRGAIPALWEASGKSPLDLVPNIPEIKTGDDSIESKIEKLPLNIAAGLGDFALGTARFLTSPQGVAAGGVGAIGPVARRAVAAGFAPLLTKQAAEKLGEASVTHDPRAATEGVLLGAAAGLTAKHAAVGEQAGMANDKFTNDKGSPNVEIPKVETVVESSDLSTGARKVWNDLKASKDEFSGADVSHLTPEDRRMLAKMGLSLSENRDRKIVATYPAKLRAEDLRQQVTRKTEQKLTEETKETPIPEHRVEGNAPVQVPIASLSLSEDVPQFKKVTRPLGGNFDPTGVGPIQLWRRSDGRLEVISGRHRFELAKKNGVKDILAQIHDESKGFDKQAAARLDAELNIRDEYGDVSDYANYFKNSGITESEAVSRGLLAREKGRAGFRIAKGASDDLFALHQSERISNSQAEAIAQAAPGNAGLQAVGIRVALDGKPAEMAADLIRLAKQRVDQRINQGQQADLFGFDDTAIQQMEAQAKLAGKERSEIKKEIQAIKGAAKNPALAAKHGVDVSNPEGVVAKVSELENRLEDLRNHPELAGKASEPSEPLFAKPESVEEQKARFAKEAEQKARTETKDKLAQAAQKPLVGTMGDIGQGDLLGGGDLFSSGKPISVGPGAASTGEIAPANLAQLTSAITRLADEVPETSPAKAFDVGRALSSAKESASGALEGLTVVSKYLVKKQEGRPEWNSFKEILGDRHLALSESVHNARKFSERALKEVPDKELQEAISNWVDTGGDEALLSAAAAESKGKYKAGYERALKLTPEQKLFAANLKNYFEARLEDAQKAGILEDGIENYIHRVYEKESAWKKGVMAELGSGVFTGKPALAKKRVFEFDFEAERAGLKPIKSFVKRVMAYDLALNKAIADRQYVKANMEVRMPDGRPAIDVAGLGSKTIPPEGEGATATLINPKWKPTDPETPAKYRGDYVAFDHPALRKWKWVSSDEAGNPTFVQGDVLVHPDAIKALRPVLEASRIRKNPVGRALLNTGSMVKQTMLDLSLFHPVQIAVHGFEHRSFKPAAEIDFTNPEVRGLIKGGMVVGETSGRAAFDEGLSGSSLTKHIPSLGPKIVELKDWIFQSYIPRLKVSTGLHALERNRARFPDLSEAELNHLTAEQMNHAFGELNYEMMGRTKTAQDALRLTALAPDFLEARAKFVTDAFTVYGREQTQALLYGAIGLYVLARILNKTISGQYRWETENAFSVIYKGKAYGLRTVQGDIIHAATDPMHFTRNRLNPAVTRPIMEAITQRDEFGRKRGLGEQAVDYVKTAIPISIKGLFQGREKTLFESLMNSTGVTVRRATANAGIHKKMRDWMEANKIQTGPGEFIYDPDKDQYRKIRLAALEGDVAGTRKEIEAAIKEGVPRRKIMLHFSQSVTRPMTGSRKNDAAFKQSLSDDDKLTFEEAKRERAQVFQVVRQAAR